MTAGPPARLGRESLGEDTQPQQVIAPGTSPEQALGGMTSALLVRASVSGGATVVLLVAAVFLFRHGVRVDHFPAFVAGAGSTPITRYSGPWIAAAFAATLVAGLTFTYGLIDLLRTLKLRRAR